LISDFSRLFFFFSLGGGKITLGLDLFLGRAESLLALGEVKPKRCSGPKKKMAVPKDQARA
jgi:hypothetical protein